MALTPQWSGAFGLGEAELRSYLGQPLRVRVPVIADNIEEVGCVIVNARSEEQPAPRNIHSEVITQGDRILLEVRSLAPINELTVSLRLTAGCTNAVSRDYTMFLDPPPAIALAESAGNDTADAQRRVAGAATAAGGEGVSGAGKGRPARRRLPAGAPVAVPGRDLTAAAAPQASATPEAVNPAATPRRRVVAPAPAAPTAGERPKSDRLVLMHDLDEPALSMSQQVAPPEPAGANDEERMRQIQREQARLVAVLTNHDPDLIPSEREVALQKQLAELSTNIETLGKQVNDVSARNRALESARLPRTLPWVFAAITLLAFGTAGWLAWRYRELQRRVAETPWWEQTKIAPVSEFGEHGEFDHGPASTEGVEVVEVMPNTVPRPAPTGTGTEPQGPEPGSEVSLLTSSVSGSGRQSVPAITPYRDRPAVIPLWPAAEADANREREEAEARHSYIPFGLVSVTGSVDEQVNPESIPLTLDLELDLPGIPSSPAPPAPPGTPAGATAGSTAAEAELAASLPPLNLEIRKPPVRPVLPLPPAKADSANESTAGEPMAEDSILRQDDVLATMPMATVVADAADQANVQFRLVQFAAVLEQIDELEKSREPAKVVALLRQYVLRDESIPTLFWLLLFRFYKQINKKPVYEALGEHFARRYRRPMVGWDEELASRTPQVGVKELPAIDERLRDGWGTLAGVEAIRSLLCDRDQSDAVVFNGQLQRELLQMVRVFPFDETA